MPSYTIDYITADGPRREMFTLDQDRPVGAQMRRVIAELRHREIVLLGGRDDSLSIEWNGAALDETLTPDVLGLTAHRPIELRMRPRRVAPIEVRAAPRTGRARSPFVPLGVVSSSVLGGLGGALAWTTLALLPVAVGSNEDRDALAIVMLLGFVGLLIVFAQHGVQRRLAVGLLTVVVGAALTASVCIALSAEAADANSPFLVRRLVLFVTLGALGTLTLAIASPAIGSPAAVLEASGLGTLAGVACGLLDSAESLGVGSAIAWPMLGALLGGMACWPRLRRSQALCELLPPRMGLTAPFQMRSYALPHGGFVKLVDGASVRIESGEARWEAVEPMHIAGQGPLTSGVAVNGDRVQVGSRVYRFRELP